MYYIHQMLYIIAFIAYEAKDCVCMQHKKLYGSVSCFS